MRIKIAEFHLANDRDLKACSRRARLLAGLTDLTRRQRANLSKAFLSAGSLVLADGGEMAVEFSFASSAGVQIVEVLIRTAAPPIQEAELQQVAGLVDQFRLSREDEDGRTLIRLGQQLPADAAIPHEVELIEWGLLLQAKSAESALLESQKRRRADGAELAAAHQRSDDLQQHLGLDSSSLETLNMLSLVANKTDNAVLVLDTQGVIEWANAAFARQTGYTLADVAGRRCLEVLCDAATSPDACRALEEALRLGHGASEELQLCRKDGSPFWSSLTLTPVADDCGNVCRWIGIGADVTRRRQAHEALEKAKEDAEAASRAKSEFLANMSHELRTPMNAIIGMTELALATELSGEQHDYLATVRQSATALLDLLNDILDLSKIEAGKMEIESTAFDLNELLTTTLTALALRAGGKGLELVWRLPPDVPAHLVGDPHRLRQVVINLVSNAIKFTERGQVVVDIERQWESDEAVGLHFSVADTGIGIPPDRLDKIFEAFEQADSSTTRRYGGTGLGLTICSQLIRLLDGKMWVRSQVGKGSTFHFSLRLKIHRPTPVSAGGSALPDTVTKRRSTASTSPLTQPPAATPLKVLVADDHPANRDLVAAILRKRGHRVAFAADGREALCAMRREPFDAALVDIQMPEMDGLQVAAAVREHELDSGRHLPIIAVTAHAMKGDREKCLAAGMDAYLPKPIHAAALQTLVEELAGSSAPAAINTAAPPPPSATAGHFDFSAALDRLGGDRELLKRQMKFFLSDAPELMTHIRAAVASRDGTSLKLAAHRLKGLSATFDASRAVELARQLETLGQEGVLDAAEPLAAELSTCIGAMRHAIQRYLSEPQG
jgi:PAS domain S-box-containing protein